MTYKGEFGLEFENRTEEMHFLQTRRLAGFHTRMVKEFFEEDAWKSIMGSNWNEPEPRGRGTTGTFGMALRYACLDHWFRDEAIEKGKFTRAEVDNWWAVWKVKCKADKVPIPSEELLDFWRANRKDRAEAKRANRRKRKVRRQEAWEREFNAERDPGSIYRRLRATLPATTLMDEQLLRSYAAMLAQANELLFQAETIKEDGVVPIESMSEYAKMLDVFNKSQKQISDLLKSHGYDYQARRSRREAQTAADIFDDFVDEAATLFDTRAIEIVCKECKMSLGYLIRNFPTVTYRITSPACPRCGKPVTASMEAMPDEVVDA